MENLVGYARRNFLVPVPLVTSFEAFNEDLQARCRAELDRQVRGKPATKEAWLIQERASLLPVPVQAFEARRIVVAKANSLALVRFDRNDYSVPKAVRVHEPNLEAYRALIPEVSAPEVSIGPTLTLEDQP